MKILCTGTGGRAHVAVRTLANSPHVTGLFCSPGSDAIAEIRLQSGKPVGLLPFPETAAKAIADWARDARFDLVIPGSEAALAADLGGYCRKYGIPFSGPDIRGARFETSKAFSQQAMVFAGIPHPAGRICETVHAALSAAEEFDFSCAIKADGLALGKGVLLCHSESEVGAAVQKIMIEREFGSAGDRVVVQNLEKGREASIHIIADGELAFPLEVAQDYKNSRDDGEGLNTGGMGSYSSSRLTTETMQAFSVYEDIIERWRAACRGEEITYRGILFPGVMLTERGMKVLEFGVRIGDPEAQSLFSRFEGDLAELMHASATDKLQPEMLRRWSNMASVCVVVASRGYPGKPDTGHEITGIDEAEKQPGVQIFHAGTKREGGKWYNTGGRVLGVTATAPTVKEARERAYAAVGMIQFEGMWFRKNIADDGL